MFKWRSRQEKRKKRLASRTDDDLLIGRLDPNLPLSEVIQDLRGTYPAQEIRCFTDHADCTGLAPQHELDHTRSGIEQP